MSKLKKVLEIELNDDAVVKAVFNQTVGYVFPVMQMHYNNGKYLFIGYDAEPDDNMIDVTPQVYGVNTFA